MESQTATELETRETVPLQFDADGIVRVGDTRVTLDTSVMAFMEGATAEEIAQQYPSVALAGIYYTIGYFLRRQSEVEAYLYRRRRQAEQVWRQNESRSDLTGIRERLVARPTSERL